MTNKQNIEELDLRRMYEVEKMTITEIARDCSVSRSAIWNRLKDFEIPRRKRKIEGIEEADLRRMYDYELMSLQDIAKYYDTTAQTIRRHMQEYGIKRRSYSDAQLVNPQSRVYNINADFFKIWTHESAWIYGWTVGDGHLSRYSLGFDIHRRDEAVLHKFKEIMKSKHLIKNADLLKPYGKYYYSSYIRFNSKPLVDSIKNISYYDIPEEYNSDFIRGFFEAEGSPYWHKNNRPKGGNIASSFPQNDYAILNFIWTKLKDNNIVKGGSLSLDRNTWKLSFRVADTLSLYHYLYDNCGDLHLPRKKEKFEELIRRQLA